MGNFDRSTKTLIERGVYTRVLYTADLTVTFPTGLRDVLDLATGATKFDPKTGWVDLGGTKDGLAITRTVNKTQWGYDQIKLAGSEVDSWAHKAVIKMAEITPDHLKVAWEAGSQSTLAAGTTPVTPAETLLNFGDPTTLTQRRWAFIYMRKTGILAGYVFREGEISGDSDFTMPADNSVVGVPLNLEFYPDDDPALAVADRVFTYFETNTAP